MSAIGTFGVEGASAEDTTKNPVPRPISSDHRSVRKYKKVFKVFTYGIASIMFKSGNQQFITTSLARIPWDRLHWYLTQSEYDLLPVDSAVTMCKCKVRMEAPRTAFESNASTSRLATIHQNKWLRVAHGLDQKGIGRSKFYTCNSTGEAMIPSGITDYQVAKYNDQSTAMWGSNNDKDSSGSYVMPKGLMGIPFPLDEYFCVDAHELSIESYYFHRKIYRRLYYCRDSFPFFS